LLPLGSGQLNLLVSLLLRIVNLDLRHRKTPLSSRSQTPLLTLLIVANRAPAHDAGLRRLRVLDEAG
jgi:hypothetical protein